MHELVGKSSRQPFIPNLILPDAGIIISLRIHAP